MGGPAEQGGGLFLPAAHLNTWVIEEHDRPSEFRSRMSGGFGISSRLSAWNGTSRHALANAIGGYRRLRPLLGGKRYLLTGPVHHTWDVWQFVSPSQDQFAILAFRDGGSVDELRVRPQGIDAERSYRIQHADEPGEVAIPGQELISDGLTLTLPSTGSQIVWGSAIGAR